MRSPDENQSRGLLINIDASCSQTYPSTSFARNWGFRLQHDPRNSDLSSFILRGVSVLIATFVSGLLSSELALAGPPSTFPNAGAAGTAQTKGLLPSPWSEETIVLKSFDSARSLPGQLYRALRLVDSDLLIKTANRVSLVDPHANLQLSCSSLGATSCSFNIARADLGWAISEVSSQAILYRALELINGGTPGASKDRDASTTTRYMIRDGRNGAFMSCAKRDGESVEFNCQFHIPNK